MNPEIWKQIPGATQKADLKLATIQWAIMKAATAIVSTTQLIIKAVRNDKPIDKELKKSITNMHANALLLLGHASTDLSHRPRVAIRPHLNKNLAGLCSDTVPVTGLLFSDNLATALKDVRALDRIGASVACTSGWQSHKRLKSGYGSTKCQTGSRV